MIDDHHDRPDEPPVITSHLAYFFVPLHGPLALPQSFVFEALEAVPFERIRSEGLPPTCVGASLCFHLVELPTAYTAETAALFRLAAGALPDSSRRNLQTAEGADDFGLGARLTTVVEMAVAVDLAGDGEPPSSDDSDGEFNSAVTVAFDQGLDYVRQFQRAYYLMRREPLRLTTRESLPFAIPYGIRQLFDDSGAPQPFQVPLSIYLLHANVPVTSIEPWSDSDSQALNTAIAHQGDNGPFTSFMDLFREAKVALTFDGAYRSAVLFAATACEVLFDDLLAHMLWEEAERPEDAAAVFDSLLTARVKRHFHQRLGGVWSPDEPGPIQQWAVSVAHLRNRVVHGGYGPTVDQATATLDATATLVEYLSDLVAGRASRYPRTANVLPGRAGLERRGKWTKALDRLTRDPGEVPWRETFARWRLAMQRVGRESARAASPSLEDANVCVVLRTDGAEQWVVHDPLAGMAAAVSPESVTGVSAGQRDAFAQLHASLRKQRERSAISTLMPGARVATVPAGSWLPEYHLVPLTGVMVDGSDLDPIST